MVWRFNMQVIIYWRPYQIRILLIYIFWIVECFRLLNFNSFEFLQKIESIFSSDPSIIFTKVIESKFFVKTLSVLSLSFGLHFNCLLLEWLLLWFFFSYLLFSLVFFLSLDWQRHFKSISVFFWRFKQVPGWTYLGLDYLFFNFFFFWLVDLLMVSLILFRRTQHLLVQ